MTSLQSRSSILVVLAVLLFMPMLARAQDYRGKVQGSITDASQAALAGAKVTLKNVGTGVEVTRQTNAEGHYIFDFVESGMYMVLVEAPGFKKHEQRNVTVENRGDLTVDARLEVGGVSEVITIQDSPVSVQFNSTSAVTTIGRELVSQLPIRGRNPYNIVTLDPTINGGENANARIALIIMPSPMNLTRVAEPSAPMTFNSTACRSRPATRLPTRPRLKPCRKFRFKRTRWMPNTVTARAASSR